MTRRTEPRATARYGEAGAEAAGGGNAQHRANDCDSCVAWRERAQRLLLEAHGQRVRAERAERELAELRMKLPAV